MLPAVSMVVAILLLSFWTVENHLKPTLLAIAEAKAKMMN
jgi:hypothetical protein